MNIHYFLYEYGIEKYHQVLENDEIIPHVLAAIRRAKSQILILMPWFYHDPIKGALLEKVREGLCIKIAARPYIEGGAWKDNSAHEKTLIDLDQAGIQVVINNHIHAKLVIIDKKEVFLMTKNFTTSGAIDIGQRSKLPSLIKKYLEIFYRYYYQSFCNYQDATQYATRIQELMPYF